MDGRARRRLVERVARIRQRLHPDLDVRALELADRALTVRGQAAEVALLDDDQLWMGQGELDLPLDELAQRLVRTSGPDGTHRTAGEELLRGVDEEPFEDRLL